MSTPFDRLDRMASRAVDRLNASAFTLTPMFSAPNGPRRRDLDRPIVAGQGVLDNRAAEMGIQLGQARKTGGGNDLQTLQVGRIITLSIDVARYFPDRTLGPRQGDAVAVDGQMYTISSARPDGQARIVCTLIDGKAV